MLMGSWLSDYTFVRWRVSCVISAVKEGAGRVRRHWRLGQIWCARQVWHMQHCCSVGEPRHPPTSFGLENEQKRLLGDLNYPSIHFLCLRYPHLCHGRLKLEEKNKQANKQKKKESSDLCQRRKPPRFLSVSWEDRAP